MNFADLSGLGRYGFQGFVAVTALQASDCQQVPAEPGIYLVVRSAETAPVFLSKNKGGHFKAREPTAPVVELENAQVEGVPVLYIGKAGGPGRQTTLRSRLRDYMSFGAGKPTAHWGGRYIWQLADAEHLLVCWKVLADEDPAEVESRLIQEFKTRYGKRPFANLRD
jgi:hypothetical protein